MTELLDEAADALERRVFFDRFGARLRGTSSGSRRLGGNRGRAGRREQLTARPFGVSARRGEIWLVDFGEPVGSEQAGRRPAVVVSADPLNQSQAGVVIVVPCTTRRRDLPSHVELDPERCGLNEVSYAKCEDVKSVSDRRLVARLGAVNDEALFAITTRCGSYWTSENQASTRYCLGHRRRHPPQP